MINKIYSIKGVALRRPAKAMLFFIITKLLLELQDALYKIGLYSLKKSGVPKIIKDNT